MKLKGGYKIRLSNAPVKIVNVPEIPDKLFLRRQLNNVSFTEVLVEPNSRVKANTLLAVSPNNGNMPLLAPLDGVVESVDDDHIILKDLARNESAAIIDGLDTVDTLFNNGCFRYITNAFTGNIANCNIPQAIIVGLTSCDCYTMADDFELIGSIDQLAEGLKLLAGLASDLKLHVVVTQKQQKKAAEKLTRLSSVAGVELLTIPDKYGLANPKLLADKLGYKPDQNIWSVAVQGVFAATAIISDSRPANALWLAVAGPAVNTPQYYNVPVGYPLTELLRGQLDPAGEYRVLNGGALTGRIVAENEPGLAADTTGITVLNDKPTRQLLKFARFGLDDMRFEENYSTLLQGELRACVSCGYCQKVCPAGLMPDYLHRLLYDDDLDKAELAGLDKCVGCGLCSYICVSKIELTAQFAAAKVQLAQEKAEAQGEAC